jgi:putative NIF3 family GTP cyclohydrolase 1 type 2
MNERITAADVVVKMKRSLGSSWTESSADGFQIGSPETLVTGVGVAWTPTLEVLRKAVAEKKNLIVTKEGPFWEDSSARLEQGVSGRSPKALIEGTSLYRFKQDYLLKHDLVVWRFSANWDQANRNFGLQGLATALGWEKLVDTGLDNSLGPIGAAEYTVPTTTLLELIQMLKQRLKMDAPRALGDPSARIQKVVLCPGFLTKLNMMAIERHSKPDAILCGDACEWETFEYCEDLITAGWSKAMVLLGLAASQDAGAKEVAAWVDSLGLNLPVSCIETGSPFTPVTGRQL